MAKKKPSLSTVVAFMSNDTKAQIETAETSSNLMIPVNEILPDPDQPRQLFPSELIEAVFEGRLSRVDAIREWLGQVEGETDSVSLRHNIQALKRLAGSIEQHGLISPISIRKPKQGELLPPGVSYLIVTGERRYWSYIYLLSEGKQIHEGDTTLSPIHIKATIASDGVTIRAHQLIENILREDINAVEKAHGMWSLRYELSGVNYSSPKTGNYEERVNYSSPKLVTWAKVEENIGISKRYRIFVISVLKLCEEAQKLAGKYNLAEMTIRPITQKLKDRPELQIKALKQLIAWQAENDANDSPGRPIVASVKEMVDNMLFADIEEDKRADKSTITRAVSSGPVVRLRKKIRQPLDFLNRLKVADKDRLANALHYDEFADVMLDLRNLHKQLNTILEAVDKSGESEDG